MYFCYNTSYFFVAPNNKNYILYCMKQCNQAYSVERCATPAYPGLPRPTPAYPGLPRPTPAYPGLPRIPRGTMQPRPTPWNDATRPTPWDDATPAYHGLPGLTPWNDATRPTPWNDVTPAYPVERCNPGLPRGTMLPRPTTAYPGLPRGTMQPGLPHGTM